VYDLRDWKYINLHRYTKDREFLEIGLPAAWSEFVRFWMYYIAVI
jgi:hypothetical protein